MIETRSDFHVMMGLIASFADAMQHQEQLPSHGAMMAMLLSARECAEFVERQRDSATVIALNAARSRRMFTRGL